MSDPLRSLADAARAVTAAATDEDVLEIVAQAARDVIGARHGVARRGRNGAPTGPRLVAPLVARDGASLGMIELWDKDGEFTRDDEAIVMAALVVERAADGPRAVVEHLESTAVALAGGNPRDDIACLAVQITTAPLVSGRFAATPHAARDVAAALAPVSGELGDRTAQDVRLLATELVAKGERARERHRVWLELEREDAA